jgi:CheY-like chemotaxis protein
MTLTSLLVCADPRAVQVLSRILVDLGIAVEHCSDPSAAALRLAAQHFDAILLDCDDQQAAIELIAHARKEPANKTTLFIAMVDARNQVRDLFSKGVNFIVYKPISPERASNSLRAAKGLLRRERRRNKRIPLHTKVSMSYGAIENAAGTLVDLSQDGIAIQSESKVPINSKVYLQFSVPGHASHVRLSGEAAWQDASGRVGIRFADVPQTSRHVLKEWLKARHAEAALRDANKPEGLGLLSVSAGDRRVKSRLACRLGADVFSIGSSVPHRCSLSDIGTGGCYVETTEPFPAGTAVEIVVRTHELKLRVQGTVQTMHTGFGMGVQFSLNTSEERVQVEQLIAWQTSQPEIPV